MIVMKFGGASTTTAAGIHSVVDIVRTHADRTPLVVVSAIGKTTRAIDRAARLAADGLATAASAACKEICETHLRLSHEALGHEKCFRASQRINDVGNRLSQLIEGIAIVRELSSRSLDACLSLGEHFASAIFSEAIDGTQYIAAESVMITDDAFGHAAPRVEIIRTKSQTNILPAIEKGAIVLTEGYVGATDSGVPTTMGMESSDYSATLLGAALGAEEVQIWTNVDGMMTVDPRLFDGAKTIPALTYDEAEEFAALGAKVLHPRTITPVRAAGIPLVVRNAAHPGGSCTRITAEISPVRIVKAIAVVDHVQRNNFSSTESISIQAEYLFSLRAAREQISWHGFGDANSDEETSAVISLVGDAVGTNAALLRAALDTAHDITVEAVIYGASPRSISMIIASRDVPEVVAKFHARFLDR